MGGGRVSLMSLPSPSDGYGEGRMIARGQNIVKSSSLSVAESTRSISATSLRCLYSAILLVTDFSML